MECPNFDRYRNCIICINSNFPDGSATNRSFFFKVTQPIWPFHGTYKPTKWICVMLLCVRAFVFIRSIRLCKQNTSKQSLNGLCTIRTNKALKYHLRHECRTKFLFLYCHKSQTHFSIHICWIDKINDMRQNWFDLLNAFRSNGGYARFGPLNKIVSTNLPLMNVFQVLAASVYIDIDII